MFEYLFGEKLLDKEALYYKNKLKEEFAREYDAATNRLWNCLNKDSVCMEFEDARYLNIPCANDLLFYLERQNKIFKTTFSDICKYVDQLEPWEYIDAYIFDQTFRWLLSITNEDLKCVIVGL